MKYGTSTCRTSGAIGEYWTRPTNRFSFSDSASSPAPDSFSRYRSSTATRRLLALGRSNPSVPAAGSQPQTEQARATDVNDIDIENAATKSIARARMTSPPPGCRPTAEPAAPAAGRTRAPRFRRAVVAWGRQEREPERARWARPAATAVLPW